MPMTHVLNNRNGDLWHLTTPEGLLVDAVMAPSHAQAALAVQHLLPRDGRWQGPRHGRYVYPGAGPNRSLPPGARRVSR